MSNSKSQGKRSFGRDAGEFIRLLEKDSKCEQFISDSGIHIISLVSNDGGLVKLRVLVENGAGSESVEFSLLDECVNELGLSIGDINGDIMPEIERSAEVTRAYLSACSSLAFADSSCRALERKLIQKGFARDIAEDAVGIVLSRELVNESNIVESRVRIFLQKRWGKMRIVAKLREEGFCDKAISHALNVLRDVDFAELCTEHLRRKYQVIPSDSREREKIYAALMRYGYASGEIRAAFKMLADE